MKLIIAGSRDLNISLNLLNSFIKCIVHNNCPLCELVTEIVSGDCKGIDHLGEKWAHYVSNDLNIPIRIKKFPAKWDNLGKSAGPIRNQQMAEYADALLIIHNGSNGSINMKRKMIALGKPVFEMTLMKYN